MFCPHKNSYLQLVCCMNPRVINKAVDQALEKKELSLHTEKPAAQRLKCMQPSLYAPHVDITRARLGFGRVGLRIINRELHSTDHLTQLQALHSILDQPSLYAPHVDITRARLGFGRVGLRIINRELHSTDHLTQLQALHSILDQVEISEHAIFLINIQVVYRIMDLMFERDPVIREKVCLILTHLAEYYQGRQRIMSRGEIVDNLMKLFLRDRKEIRYAAAYTLKTLTRSRCACEMIIENKEIIENLLKMIKSDHTGIVLLHLKSLENLTEWDPVRALKANAFQVMLMLFEDKDSRIVSHAMDCMTQLCKHEIGMKLADIHDLTFVLQRYTRFHHHIEVVIAAVGLMAYTTLTTRSKWRAKERCYEITKRLVKLCHSPNKPLLQLRCIQVLINLCDCPDIRYYIKMHWEQKVMAIKIRNNEMWDGTSETTSYGLATGHNYRTMCIEQVETIKNDYGDNALVVNVHSYLKTVAEKKAQLIRAINWKSYRD